jgi:hypothetical protein
VDDAVSPHTFNHLRAYGADDDNLTLSILYSVWVTLADCYWVTSDERRSWNIIGTKPSV